MQQKNAHPLLTGGQFYFLPELYLYLYNKRINNS